MMRKILLPILLLALPALADPLNQLYSGDALWMPSSFMNQGAVPAMRDKILGTTCLIGTMLILFTLFAEGARLSLGRGVKLAEVFRVIAKHVLVATLVSTKFMWSTTVVAAVLKPAEAVISLVKGFSTEQAIQSFGEALLTASSAAYEGVQSLATTLLTQGIASLLFGFFAVIALCISFALSLYICVMWTILFCVGPMFVPCMLFQPLSSIGWAWLRSFVAFSLMGAVGAMAMGLLVGGGMLTNAIKSGATGDILSALPWSIVVIIVTVGVPRFTLKLFDGMGADPMGVARSAATIAGTAASAGAVGGGVAAMGAGGALQAAGKAGSAVGSFVGSSRLAAGAERLAQAGKATSQFGNAAFKSQTPNLQKGAFPTFSKWAGTGKKDA